MTITGRQFRHTTGRETEPKHRTRQKTLLREINTPDPKKPYKPPSGLIRTQGHTFKAGNANTPSAQPESPSRLPCMLLSGGGDVSAVGYDPELFHLYAANGTVIDVLEQSDLYWHRIAEIDVGEPVTAVSAYRGNVVAATPTKVLYYHQRNYSDPETIATAAAEDVLSAVKGGTWTGPAYDPPEQFIVVVDAAGWAVYDVTNGAPVADTSGALLSASCCDYADGHLFVGSNGFGAERHGWIDGSSQIYSTVTSPAIAGDSIFDISTASSVNFPYFAFATDGGVSYSIDNVSIYNITGQAKTLAVGFNGNTIVSTGPQPDQLDVHRIKEESQDGSAAVARFYSTSDIGLAGDEATIVNDLGADLTTLSVLGSEVFTGSPDGLTAIELQLVREISGVRFTSAGDRRITSSGDVRVV